MNISIDKNTRKLVEKIISKLSAILLIVTGSMLTFYTQKYFYEDTNSRSIMRLITEKFPSYQSSLENCSKGLYEDTYNVHHAFSKNFLPDHQRKTIEEFYIKINGCEQLSNELSLFLQSVGINYSPTPFTKGLNQLRQAMEKNIQDKSRSYPLIQYVESGIAFKKEWDTEAQKMIKAVFEKQKKLSESL